MFRQMARRVAILGLVAAGLALALVACGDDEPEPQTLAITAGDFVFDIDGDLKPGATRIEFTNDGQYDHHVQLISIAGDHTVEEALQAIEAGPPPEWLGAHGGVGGLSPGETAVTYEDLPAGHYALLCFFEEPDGVPHFAKGMQLEFDIEGDTVEADLPDTDLTVTAVDAGDGSSYSFEAPDTVEAGETNIRFQNNGSELHEMNIIRLPDGTTMDQLGELLGSEETPEGVVGIGGAQGVVPGDGSQTVAVDFEAGGSYLLLCGIPNAEGVPHLERGMVHLITVE
jgi:plastocyanin